MSEEIRINPITDALRERPTLQSHMTPLSESEVKKPHTQRQAPVVGIEQVQRTVSELNAAMIGSETSLRFRVDTEADMPLQELLRVCRDQGIFVIAEGETSSLTGSWPLLQAVKSHRCGIVLQPDQMDGDTLFRTPFPRTTRPEFPAGRGLMVQGGQVTKVQVAVPE